MSFLRIYYSLIFLVCAFCWGCTPNEKISSVKHESKLVIINQNFSTEKLNDKVIVCKTIDTTDFQTKDLRAFIKKNAITVQQKKEAILLGPYRQYPKAWFYTQVINTDSLSYDLVVDEFNHIRCDAIEVLTFKDGNTKKWGKIGRLTPFSDYQIPFMTYAIPISILPKDTLNLLIHTQRYNGFHEVNLTISSRKIYLSEHIYHFLSKILQSIIFIICAIMMFILGKIFDFKTMTYFGFYLISLLFMHLTSWGFTDSLITFTGIGLSANNSSTFTVFVSVIFFHPFFMELMKKIPKNDTLFNAISYGFMVINFLITCCYFLPVEMFRKIDTYPPNLMILSAFSAIFWMLYWSLIALFRAKTYYLLIGLSMSFLPFILQQLTSIFEKSPIYVVKISHPTFIFVAIGFTIICIYLLREQLVTRKNYEANIVELKVSLEEIRKSEVTGIGRNLHDNVGNILATALGYLNLNQKNTVIVENLVQEAIKEIRFLSHNLVKNEELPVKIKIERLIEHFNEFSNINYIFSDYSNEGINKITKEQQINLYYIIQELFTNTLKHSFATEAILQIFADQKRLWITLEDDGIGLKSGFINKGIGLINIHKRADLSNFKVNIDSTSKGTNTTIEIIS